MALYSAAILSRSVGQCKNALNILGHTFRFTCLWVLIHRNTERNERVYRLAKRGSVRFSIGTVCVPLATIKGEFYSHYLTAADLK